MQLKIEKPNNSYRILFASDLFKSFWRYNDIFVEDLKVSYNDFHGFWDVTINRGPLFKAGYGRGSVEYQKNKWKSNIEKIEQLHPTAKVGESWTWDDITGDCYLDENDLQNNGRVCCPAARLFIYNEEK